MLRPHLLWTEHVNHLGNGIGLTTHLKTVSTDELADAITICVFNTTSRSAAIRRGALSLKRRMRMEDGTAYATALVGSVATERMAELIEQGHPSATSRDYVPAKVPSELAGSEKYFVAGSDAAPLELLAGA